MLAALLRATRAGAQAAPSTTAADEAAITEFNRRYVQAINDGDIDTLASLTTEGHMMISSGGAAAHRQAGARRCDEAHVFETTDFDESWAPEETVISGDLAYQRGTFVVVAKPKAGGAETRMTGNFLRIYRKIDGAWFMVRDSFNAQQPRARQ